jgi:hypothetical protein
MDDLSQLPSPTTNIYQRQEKVKDETGVLGSSSDSCANNRKHSALPVDKERCGDNPLGISKIADTRIDYRSERDSGVRPSSEIRVATHAFNPRINEKGFTRNRNPSLRYAYDSPRPFSRSNLNILDGSYTEDSRESNNNSQQNIRLK